MIVLFNPRATRPRNRRLPLSVLALAAVLEEAATGLDEWFGVMARKATKRPDELTEGRMLSVPTRAPFESREMRDVAGLHESAAPAQVSRT